MSDELLEGREAEGDVELFAPDPDLIVFSRVDGGGEFVGLSALVLVEFGNNGVGFVTVFAESDFWIRGAVEFEVLAELESVAGIGFDDGDGPGSFVL